MKTLFFASLLMMTHSSFAQELSYKLLSERRLTMTYPEYGLGEKKIVLDQVRLVFKDLFVHRDIKIEHFGKDSDPLPLIDTLESEMDKLSTKVFHERISSIFNKQKDFHTSYQLPVPFSCHRTFVPFSFKEVKDSLGNKVIAVKAISNKEDVVRNVPVSSKVRVGDVLVSFNGIETEKYLQGIQLSSAGANPDAIRRSSVTGLGYINHKYSFLPGSDSAILVFKDRLEKYYTQDVPWIVKLDVKCSTETPTPPSADFGLSQNDNQIEITNLFRKSPTQNNKSVLSPDDGLQTTADPILKYRIINNEFGRFGHIVLESFVPEKLKDDELVNEVKKLLMKELAGTDGLIFDVRDNGGGYINIAERLVQLFTPKKTTPLGFRLRASAANLHYMRATRASSPFTASLEMAVMEGLDYTKPLSLYDSSYVSDLGQFYFKPVVVLTNANCYSSCDMFSAQMQDYGAAIIVGEDSTTGAGGANNVKLRDFYDELPATNVGPFLKLPSGQNIGFAWRQTLRTGLSAGQLIEDDGIKSDLQIDSSLSDLYSQSLDQLKVISEKLIERSGDYRSWVRLENEARHDIVLGQPASLKLRWGQTTEIKFNFNGISEVYGTSETQESLTSIYFPSGISVNDFKAGRFEMEGAFEGKTVWRKMVNYRVVKDFFDIPSGSDFTFDLTKPDSLFVIYENNRGASNWLLDNGLKIPKDYKDSSNSEASCFFKIPTGSDSKISFKTEINTEAGFDFLEVFIVSDGKEKSLEKLSGVKPLSSYEYNLKEFAGKNVELRFKFTSDTGVNGEGISISDIKLMK